MKEKKIIGKIISTSTENNIELRLDPNIEIEALELGQYLTVEGEKFHYITKLTNIFSIEMTSGILDQQLQFQETSQSGIELGHVPSNLRGGHYGYRLEIELIKSIAIDDDSINEPNTIPPLFSSIRSTTSEDISKLYNEDDSDKEYVLIGTLRGITEDKVPAKIDLIALLSLHGAIFAKTGSGKTFLGRLLAGHVTNFDMSSALIFDMHSEYGYHPLGLKGIFRDKVVVMGIEDTKEDSGKDKLDETLELPRNDLQIKDIKMIISLSEPQERVIYKLRDRLGQDWLDIILEADEELDNSVENSDGILNFENMSLEQIKINLDFTGPLESSFKTAIDKLKYHVDELPFIVPSKKANKNSIERILDYLQTGSTIIINFGSYANDSKVYAFVTNLISRRLLDMYQISYKKMDPKKITRVLIMLEEAHKFLNKDHLETSFFGRFVREARKFNLGLLLIDQRPSQIHEEVLSQIGTQFLMQLSNKKDRKVISEQSEESLDEFENELKRLNKQEFIAVGRACDFVISGRVLDQEDIVSVLKSRTTVIFNGDGSNDNNLEKVPKGGF